MTASKGKPPKVSSAAVERLLRVKPAAPVVAFTSVPVEAVADVIALRLLVGGDHIDVRWKASEPINVAVMRGLKRVLSPQVRITSFWREVRVVGQTADVIVEADVADGDTRCTVWVYLYQNDGSLKRFVAKRLVA
jgi:hypothetical protein